MGGHVVDMYGAHGTVRNHGVGGTGPGCSGLCEVLHEGFRVLTSDSKKHLCECSDDVGICRAGGDGVGDGVQCKVARFVGFFLVEDEGERIGALCFNDACFHLVADEWRDEEFVENGQSNDEDGHETEVFVPALQFPAILEQGGNGRRRYEGCDFVKLEKGAGHAEEGLAAGRCKAETGSARIF
jgi:hypothetical protein